MALNSTDWGARRGFDQLRSFAGVEVPVWLGVMGPAGMPGDVVERLNTAFLAALRSEVATRELDKYGADLVLEGPGPFAKVIKEDLDRWEKVIKGADIKIQ